MLRPVGNGIHRIELPLSWPPWTVNSYIIDDSSLTLIDTGIGGEESLEILECALGDLGFSIKEVERIFLTHAHLDHYGLGTTITRFCSAKVFVHPYEKDRLVNRLDQYWKLNQKKILGYFSELDLPEDIHRHFTALIAQCGNLALPLAKDRIRDLAHRQKIRFDRFTLEVLHLPGHSPGHIALMDSKKRFVFSGDLLLIKHYPCPLVDLDWGSPWKQFKGLEVQIDSIRKLNEMKVKQILPGHWEPFSQSGYFVDRLLKENQRLQEDLRLRLGREEKTVYQLARDFCGEISDAAMLNYLPEIIGTLNLLTSQGKLKSEMRGGKIVYRSA